MTNQQIVRARDMGHGIAITVLTPIGTAASDLELPYVGSYTQDDRVHAAAAVAIARLFTDPASLDVQVKAENAQVDLLDLVHGPRPAPSDDAADLFRVDLRELWSNPQPGTEAGHARLKRQLAATWPALYRIIDAEVGA